MKIRFSKTLAAVLAATTLTAISGISVMAASVITTTNYEWDNNDATVQVTSVVASEKEGAQVTYLVAAANPSAEGAIKYIDQAPIKDGKATFTFTAKQSEIYAGATISAKFGSDDSDVAGAMKPFTFADGVDFFNNGTTACTESSIYVSSEDNYTIFYGDLTGQAKEYGIKLDGKKYPAMATTPNLNENKGQFAVVIQGWQYDKTLGDTDPNHVSVEFYAE